MRTDAKIYFLKIKVCNLGYLYLKGIPKILLEWCKWTSVELILGKMQKYSEGISCFI